MSWRKILIHVCIFCFLNNFFFFFLQLLSLKTYWEAIICLQPLVENILNSLDCCNAALKVRTNLHVGGKKNVENVVYLAITLIS